MPDFDVLSGELHIYAKSIRRMKVIKKDHNDGMKIAFTATIAVQQTWEVI